MKSPNILVVAVLWLLLLMAVPGKLPAGDTPHFSFMLQYTPTGETAYSVTVPHSATRNITVPVQISGKTSWIVYVVVFEDGKTVSVDIQDPSLSTGSVNASSPAVVVFTAGFETVYGKPITVLKSSAGILELTLSNE